MIRPITNNCRRFEAVPEKQAKVLEFIETEVASGRPFPSDRMIADFMGWKSAGSARDCIHRLVWRGKLNQITATKFETVGGIFRRTYSVSFEVSK